MNRLNWRAFVVCACSVVIGHTAPGAEPTKEAPQTRVAVFRLHGPMPEASRDMDLSLSMEPKRSLYSVLDRLSKARKDENLKAVVFAVDEPQFGWAQMQELRQAILDLKQAGKPVYCYLESAGASVYQLATAATQVCLTPAGDLNLTGMHVEEAYFKNLLDKIGVEADIVHIGAYKGAGEPYTRTGPSDEARQMMEWLVKDLYDQMVTTIAEARKLTPDKAREIIDQGPFTAREALKAGLVDKLIYPEELAAALRKDFGEEVVFDHNYGVKKGPELDFSNLFAFFKSFGQLMSEAKAKKQKKCVGVVFVEGMIVAGKSREDLFGEAGTVGSTTIRRVLNKLTDDDNIEAVVIRVDSPGGSAMASDIMWHAARELNEVKPVVISMGNVAASGGYYLSVGGPMIYADPGTLTGSIGVLGGKIVTKGLWDWVGINFHETMQGRNADLHNTNRRFTEEQRVQVTRQMQEIYGDFKDRVTQGRGNRLKKDLESIAGGRVYTGKQALELGLVDRLGGMQEAIRHAARQANMEDYEVELYPKPKNFFDLLIEGLKGEESADDGDVDVATGPAYGWTLQSSAVREALATLRRLDPQRTRTVLRSLLRVEMLNRENMLLAIPSELNIR